MSSFSEIEGQICLQISLAEVSVRTSDIHIEVALQGRGVCKLFFDKHFLCIASYLKDI